jgi:hypothetical protein
MTAIPRSGPAPGPKAQRRLPKSSADIPRIAPFSWLGLESVIWALLIDHLIKWAGNWAYFVTWQVRYAVGYEKGLWTVWYLKDFWDRLPVHVENLFSAHWFAGQAAPEWWVTDRHDARDVGIALAATIVTLLIFSKPHHAADDKVPLRVYATSLPVALAAAAVPVAIIGVLAWKVPWLTHHGVTVPASWGPWASEVNSWVAAGTWITVVMGIAGGLAAKPFLRRVADDVQWFFAERSAAKVRSDEGLDALRTHVIGTPAHRKRVHWLLDHQTALPERNPWLVRGMLALAFITLAYSAAGAWLTIWGPAAVH